ncbi:MAG: manganese/zinc/iron transport system permease protein [Verrucomicrobiales bacterium]|jgi:manganese/zinc/iron transport system permease protein
MIDLIPEFDAYRVFVEPWTVNLSQTLLITSIGLIVALSSALVGNYLVLRRMSMLGDAISHSALPGIVIAFLISGSRDSFALTVGALIAGVVTTLLIEFIHRKTIVKVDAAIGIVFSMLFALGVLLLEFAPHTDLDPDCVLFGQLEYLGVHTGGNVWASLFESKQFQLLFGVFILTVGLIVLFYKELLVSSFDPLLAGAQGFRPQFIHYAMMCVLSLIVVSAFEAVGAILVIAMLILPGASAYLLTDRLKVMITFSVIHATISTIGGVHLAVWLNCPTSACMVLVGAMLFGIAWFISSRPFRNGQ